MLESSHTNQPRTFTMPNIIALIRAHFNRPAALVHIDKVLMRESRARVLSRLA